MAEAYREAVSAGKRGECPVGAVLVKNNQIVVRAGNEEVERCDPTAHAEILCLRKAGMKFKNHNLSGCTIYTTLWPCPMCESAMLQAQISRVVSGANTFSWIKNTRFNDQNIIKDGPIMEKECRALFVEWAEKNSRLEILEEE